MRNKMIFYVLKRLRRFKLFQRQYNWMNLVTPVGAYPFFWVAKWRAYLLMHKNPYAKVWIIPRGRKPKSFDRKFAKFSAVVSRWHFDPYAGQPDA